jgi:hypothetical protein
MATSAQIHANRENATHSTGPSTDAGKATSSQNGLKHGLASGQLMIHGESEEEFNIMLAGLIAEHQAETISEILLVQDMAKYHWLADRALGMQTREINEKWGHPPANLAVLIRYQTANERAFQRAFAALTALRKARLAEIGSASKQAAARPPQPKPAPPVTPPTFKKTVEMCAKGFLFNFETNQYERFAAADKRR